MDILNQLLGMANQGQPSSVNSYRGMLDQRAQRDPSAERLESIKKALAAFGGGMSQPRGGVSHWTTRMGNATGAAAKSMRDDKTANENKAFAAAKGLSDFDQGADKDKRARLLQMLSAQLSGKRSNRADETAGLAKDRFGLSKDKFAHTKEMDKKRLASGSYGTRKGPSNRQVQIDIEKMVNRRFKPLDEFSSAEDIAAHDKKREAYRGRLNNQFFQNQAPSAPPPKQNASSKHPKPATQAEFDALPSGSLFTNPKDGKIYKKP